LILSGSAITPSMTITHTHVGTLDIRFTSSLSYNLNARLSPGISGRIRATERPMQSTFVAAIGRSVDTTTLYSDSNDQYIGNG